MWHDVDQNTDEWFELRAGKVTGSAVAKIMANYGKSFGDPAKRYAVDIAVERLKGSAISGDRYTNAHMAAGHVEEPIARMMYEDRTFSTVTNGGFFDNGKTGCSPDGLVDDDGMIEIKSVVPSSHYKTIKNGGYDSAYKWQIMFNLKESGRRWLDYVSFCDQFYDPRKLEIVRIYADDCGEFFDQIDTRLSEFETLVDVIIRDITGGVKKQ